MKLTSGICGLLALLLPGAAPAQEAEAYGEKLGTVDITVSCSDSAAREVVRGISLLHSMTYEGAEAEFVHATELDPDCAMGYWGQAMTFIHPLWSDRPAREKFERGAALLEQAGTRGSRTDMEQAFIDAAKGYYAVGYGETERPNLVGFDTGWEQAHRSHPENTEASAFYAIAHLGTVDPGDKTYSVQLAAGALAESVLAVVPDHPGAHHYMIHAYDYPPLADEALEVSHHYGEVAPSVPHALHMPTHIFTRRGLWMESIDWNTRSAEAALDRPVGGAVSLHYLHALDYLAYAWLQVGGDSAAEDVGRTLRNLAGPFQVEVASPYAMAAIPARLTLERQKWSEAAVLEARIPDSYPWDRFPAIEAITHFARALGAARSGNTALARTEIETLGRLRDEAKNTMGDYWAKQVEIQRLSALAWLQLEEGSEEEALATMKSAAELEASTEKHPVTPGEVLPSQELLADMLLELNKPAEALVAYEASLERSPRRFNSLYGAGRAAELSGNQEQAAVYYRQLVEMAAGAGTGRERLRLARAYLGNR